MEPGNDSAVIIIDCFPLGQMLSQRLSITERLPLSFPSPEVQGGQTEKPMRYDNPHLTKDPNVPEFGQRAQF